MYEVTQMACDGRRIASEREWNSSEIPMRLKAIRIQWGQSGGLTECPYFHRWVIDFKRFAIRLHHWHASDDERAFHDHPYWFITVVLWGGYDDVSPAGIDRLRIGSVRFRPANHRHTVRIIHPGTRTLLLSGPTTQRWGFWVNGKRIMRDKYFVTHGHHPCDPMSPPVRLRPDGSRR
jgi:hypothetical protein